VPAPGTVAFSIGTPIATFQGLRALQDSAGTAAAVPDDADILAAQQHLASTIGLYAEPTSAICLPGLRVLAAQGQVGPADRVVCIATSSGLKDVDATAAQLPDVPVIDADLSALTAVLERAGS
jgi:threonine synthase